MMEMQPQLFIEDTPLNIKELAPEMVKNLDNLFALKIRLINGDTLRPKLYLELSKYATVHGIPDAVLQEYIRIKGIKVSSGLPPDEPPPNIKIH